MDLHAALTQLFPTADPFTAWALQDDSDGKGPYIERWNLEQPQPTEAELQAAWEAWQAGAIDRAKTALKAQIDEACGEFRRRFVSPGFGMSDVYQLKRDIALQWLATAEAGRTEANFPIVYEELLGYKEAGTTALDVLGQKMPVTTAAEVVATYMVNNQAYTGLLIPKSERARMKAKSRAEQMTEEKEAVIILADLVADLAAIAG